MMTVSIIIVSYNTAELTVQTIDSVLTTHSSKNDYQLEIIVVDNNSTDDSVVSIKKMAAKHKNIKLIINNKNVGFGVANNQGIEQSTGELILFLNSDTVVKPKAIQRLVKTFQEFPVNEKTASLSSYGNRVDRLGILAAGLKNQDGSPQPQGGSEPSLLALASHMLFWDDLPVIGKWLPSTQHTGRRALVLADQTLAVQDWVGGTAMMVRRDVLSEVGGFDPNIFMYGEDVELCMRAKAHHWDVAVENRAEIVHLGNASGSSATAIQGELASYIYIWAKHKPTWQLPIAKLLIKIGARARRLLFGTIIRDQTRAEAYRHV